MNTESIEFKEMEGALLEFLSKAEKKEEHIEIIDELLHSLTFEKRLAMLTEEEMAHMCDLSLSPAARKRLDEAKAKSVNDYEKVIHEYARSNYFRRCFWADYLNGVTDKKPFTSATP